VTSLGILESNLEGPGYQKSEIIIKLLHKGSFWFSWTTSLFFSQNGKFPSYLDETSLKTEDFNPKSSWTLPENWRSPSLIHPLWQLTSRLGWNNILFHYEIWDGLFSSWKVEMNQRMDAAWGVPSGFKMKSIRKIITV
jgi:hypothetical protein